MCETVVPHPHHFIITIQNVLDKQALARLAVKYFRGVDRLRNRFELDVDVKRYRKAARSKR